MGYSPRGRKELDITERLHFTSLWLQCGECTGHLGSNGRSEEVVPPFQEETILAWT